MESAGYVGNVDKWEELFVWTTFQVAKAFTKVDVEESFVLDGAHGVECRRFDLGGSWDMLVKAQGEGKVKIKVCDESLLYRSPCFLLL